MDYQADYLNYSFTLLSLVPNLQPSKVFLVEFYPDVLLSRHGCEWVPTPVEIHTILHKHSLQHKEL